MRDMDRRAWSFVVFLARSASILAASALAGCATAAQSGNLQVKMLAATSQTPSNVAVNLSIGTKSGEPLTGLKPENFRIFEDGKLVPEDKAKRMLLDPKMAEAYFTVLLIDLSGPIVESQDFPELVRQVGDFMDTLRETHTLTVSIFDGRDELRTILEPDETNTKAALDRLRRYRPEERKGNLNGAVLKGLAILDRQVAKSTAAHTSSNLVVFTDRGDMAAKVPGEELDVALDKTPADVYVIGVGPGIKRPELGKIARTDAFYSTDPKEMGTGFTHLSKHLAVASEGHYLLSYCSPKRKGEHDLEIEISTEKEHGLIKHHYSADGFTKGCSASKAPAFAKKEPEKPAPDQGDTDGAGAVAGDEKTAAKSAPGGGKAAAPEADNGDEDFQKAPAKQGAKATPAAASDDDVAPPAPAKRGKSRKQQSKADKEASDELSDPSRPNRGKLVRDRAWRAPVGTDSLRRGGPITVSFLLRRGRSTGGSHA